MPNTHWPSDAFATALNQTKQTMTQMSAEQEVYSRIRKGYEAAVRPLRNPNSTLVVQLKVKLQQLVALNERTQVLTTLVFIEQTWQDDYLRWNDSEFREVRTLRVPSKYVWTPDTYVFSNADTSSSGFLKGLHVLVHSSGKMIWQVPMQMKTSCQVDIVMFPFDEQVCDIQMGSWIYTPSWVIYRFLGSSPIQSPCSRKTIALCACENNTHEALDISSFWESSEWMLLGVQLLYSNRSTAQLNAWKMGLGQRQERVNRLMSFKSTVQSDLVLRLHLKRRSFFYVWNIVIPCVMLTLLTVTVFCTPVQSGEKITLGLSVFLAFSMFMVLIAEKVPPTSTGIPLIGIYLTSVMTLTALSVVICVIVINLDSRGEKLLPVPPWLRRLVNLQVVRRMMDRRIDPLEAASNLEQTESLTGKQVSVDIQLNKCKSRTATLQNMRVMLVNQTRLLSQIHRRLNTECKDKPEVRIETGVPFCSKLSPRKNQSKRCPMHAHDQCFHSPAFLTNHCYKKPAQWREKSRELIPAPIMSEEILNNSRGMNKAKHPLGKTTSNVCVVEDKNRCPKKLFQNQHVQQNTADNLIEKQSTMRHCSAIKCAPSTGLSQHRIKQIIGPRLPQKQHALIKYEWKLVAQLVDRFVFALFLLSTGLCYTLVFLWPSLVPTDFNCKPE
ncbi:putative nachr subunit [Fasciola gigantica]|uniref:Putative nachr subunit n=1 Tax=Fasciola gigantica TaxID=46835 RepID=A0A504YC61_FASGI|nr:putative nachr subunit [Fasciola gigantica]